MADEIIIRPAMPKDEEQVWEIIKRVIKTGDTYVFNPLSSREKMISYWMAPSKHTYVAECHGDIAGTFLIADNQPDLGSHIANGAYMVHPEYRGKGIGKMMGEFSIKEAKELGYHAMQFNFVIKTNTSAVQLWKSLGFNIIGEVPDAFQHARFGLTNAYILYRKL